MKELPITSIRERFLSYLSDGLCQFIITAPPGSGKSTMVPQWLLDIPELAGKQIYVLQPRRIATVLLANYISQCRGEQTGEIVGYQIRHIRKISSSTRLCFITEGILMSKLLQGDRLEGVGAILFDEFHERHLETDVSLALALLLQKRSRKDLLLGVMSATVDVDLIEPIMPLAVTFNADGGLYSVKTTYNPVSPTERIWEAASNAVLRNRNLFESGSCLVFMPGVYEINNTIRELLKKGSFTKDQVVPLHGSLSIDDQTNALKGGYPKVVVCTNVAETSLTIPDVQLVVDSGLAKVARFDALRGVDMIFTESISKASANQRRGRAGRTQNGECIRLWSEFSHLQRSEYETPEIHRKDLSAIILQLFKAGLDLYKDIIWVDTPLKSTVDASLKLLQWLDALNSRDEVTLLGEKMANLGFNPRLSKILVEANDLGLESYALLAVAIEQNDPILEYTDKLEVIHNRETLLNQGYSDLSYDVNASIYLVQQHFSMEACTNLGVRLSNLKRCWDTYNLLIRQNFKSDFSLLAKEQMTLDAELQFRRLIFNAYSDRLAIRQNSRTSVCQMFSRKTGHLSQKEWAKEAMAVVAIQLEEEKRASGKKITIKRYSQVNREWLRDVNGSREVIEKVVWNSRKQRVVLLREELIDGLLLDRSEIEEVVDDEKAVIAIKEAIERGEVNFSGWSEECLSFIRRVNFSAYYCPEYGIPIIDDEAKDFILDQSLIGIKTIRELVEIDLFSVTKDYLSRLQLSAVDSLAPESYQLPGRRRPSVLRYTDDHECILSEVIQALYDCSLPITVADGKCSVLFELLSPARRPVQITRDLEQFWKGSYQEVKKELKGRYPKHEWR